MDFLLDMFLYHPLSALSFNVFSFSKIFRRLDNLVAISICLALWERKKFHIFKVSKSDRVTIIYYSSAESHV